MTQPCYSISGPGPVGGGGTHLYADLVDLLKSNSPAAKLLVEAALLQQLVQTAAGIRDQHSDAYKSLAGAIKNLAGRIGRTDMDKL